MSAEIPARSPEKEVVDDNARKFLVESLGPAFLKERGAFSVTLTTHFLDDQSKIVHKDFDGGKTEIWSIRKVTEKDGNRTATRQQVLEEDYEELCRPAIFSYKKERFQFNYPATNGVLFSFKYDEFDGGKLCMIEVDASTDEVRNSFDPDEFPVPLTEVTGEPGYTGYEIIGTLEALAHKY